jgi:uncharacterized protein DUF4381
MSGRISGMCAMAAAGIFGAWLGAALWVAPARSAEPEPRAPAAQAASAATPSSEEDIRDIRGPKFVPAAWVLPAIILGAAIVGWAGYRFWRWRRNRRERILLPYEIALQRLEDIRALMQPASAREFSTAVSDIVRGYIEQRFDVTVTRRTTEEFLRELLETSNASLARHRALLEAFLQQCDFVKFAAMSLSAADMESLRQSALAFVWATVKAEAPPVEEAHDALPTA